MTPDSNFRRKAVVCGKNNSRTHFGGVFMSTLPKAHGFNSMLIGTNTLFAFEQVVRAYFTAERARLSMPESA